MKRFELPSDTDATTALKWTETLANVLAITLATQDEKSRDRMVEEMSRELNRGNYKDKRQAKLLNLLTAHSRSLSIELFDQELTEDGTANHPSTPQSDGPTPASKKKSSSKRRTSAKQGKE